MRDFRPGRRPPYLHGIDIPEPPDDAFHMRILPPLSIDVPDEDFEPEDFEPEDFDAGLRVARAVANVVAGAFVGFCFALALIVYFG